MEEELDELCDLFMSPWLLELDPYLFPPLEEEELEEDPYIMLLGMVSYAKAPCPGTG